MISALPSRKYGSRQESPSREPAAPATTSWAVGMATHTMKTGCSGAAEWDQTGSPAGGRGWVRTLPFILLCQLQDQGGTMEAPTSTAGRRETRDFFSHKYPELLAKVVIYKPHYAIKTNQLGASEHHGFHANTTKASFGTLTVGAQRGKGL